MMETYSHQGIIQETVTIKFEGYQLTLAKGSEVGLFVSVNEPENFTDSQGRTWHTLEREDGSVSVYYTVKGVSAHFPVFDTLDEGQRLTHS